MFIVVILDDMSPESKENVRELLEKRASTTPEKTFLFSEADGREWTYAQFDSAVNRTANMLRSYEISKGDVVSLLLPNSAEYLIAYFACWKIGALAGPVNSLLKREEIEWVVGNSEAKLMLVGSEFISTLDLSSRDEVDRPVPPVSSSTKNSSDGAYGSVPPASAGGTAPQIDSTYPNVSARPPADASGTDPYPQLVVFDNISIADEHRDELEPVDLVPDDDAIIIYTSGTTGKPKGCLLTHGNLIANAQQIAEWMSFGENDRLLTVMPLFHMNAVSVTTMTALYAGCSTVVSPKFSASRFWDIIDKYQITSFGSVATMLSMLLNSPKPQVPRPTSVNPKSKIQNPKSETLRFAMCGSAPVPAEVLKKFEETFGVLVIEGYGLSESTCRSTFNPPNEARRPGSCGKPIGNEMKVFDEDDKEVPDGELGEIVLRGPNILKGYFKNPEATAKAFTNGWFHTGDIGYRDPDGFFYIADRKSDMIIRAGENIYPREIDDVLYTHPAVASAAVIGVPDDLYGEEVAAFVVLNNGNDTSAEDLMAFCRLHLADYKCPKTVHFLDEIPKGPTGKLLKRELAALLRTRDDDK